jgi:hypothetical protein
MTVYSLLPPAAAAAADGADADADAADGAAAVSAAWEYHVKLARSPAKTVTRHLINFSL